jgi:hypothetical protein
VLAATSPRALARPRDEVHSSCRVIGLRSCAPVARLRACSPGWLRPAIGGAVSICSRAPTAISTTPSASISSGWTMRCRCRNWTQHDLRHTGRSLMARAGVQPHIAERVLGDAMGRVEGLRSPTATKTRNGKPSKRSRQGTRDRQVGWNSVLCRDLHRCHGRAASGHCQDRDRTVRFDRQPLAAAELSATRPAAVVS